MNLRQALLLGGSLAAALITATNTSLAQSSVFTYQGRLADNGLPANGTYDFQFGIYSAAELGTSLGLLTNRPTEVSNGLFTVILDFGSGVFDGSARWLELGVRTNGSAGAYVLLSPRQELTATPYALRAAQYGGPVADGQLSSTVVSGAGAANAAAAANTPGAIVKRDSSGNFAAGAVTASSLSGDGSNLSNLDASKLTAGTLADARLSANVALLNAPNTFTASNTFVGAVSATNANNALSGSFTGPLTGDVTGNVVGNLIGAASSATNFTGALNGDVIGAQGATVVASVGGQTAANVAAGASTANSATSANTAGTIVKRDASGNFAAGTITGNLSGNATTATTAVNFTGPLAGDVTGTQGATVVGSVGGQSAANVASGAVAGNAATEVNVPGTIVKRDGAGNFAAGSISADSVSAGTIAGDGAGVTNLNGTNIVGGTVGNAQLASGAAVANLLASGQSGVASDGIIFSTNPASSSLASAGYVRIGKTVFGVDTWDQRASMPIAGRANHTPVWTGTEMIIWGGYSYNNAYISFGDGARYNPASNIWTIMATNGAPRSRYDHTAVWTGTEMIIWGGHNPTNWVSFADGARYNPLTDSWAPVSTNGAPSPRAGHTATWTGSEMVVWGGYADSGSNYLNSSDGARYNPTLDTWAPMATNTLLASRWGHVAVWTGSRVVVWGGAIASYTTVPGFGDGAIYNPVADSWAAMTTNGAPSPRYYHAAVWTGTEMIIWGGGRDSGSIYLGDGRRYNPSSDSWTPTTASSAPAARYGHIAVWTGSEMIVWGGWGGSYLNTGARYNPSSDSWQATTTTGAPAAHYVPGAVWTGAEMIFSGGSNGTYPYFSDIFSYAPPMTLYFYLKP
jgi:N-acetylneuraminic acid mutarotase